MQIRDYSSSSRSPAIARRPRNGPRRIRLNPRESLRTLVRDLATAHEMIEALATSEREARAKADAVGAAAQELLAILSHDLRTPLQAIYGYAELLEAGIHGKLNAAQRMDLSRIQQSQQQLLDLIDSVMRRVYTGRIAPPAD